MVGLEHRNQQFFEGGQRLGAGVQFFLFYPLAQLVHQLFGDLKPHIRENQLLKQFLIGILGDPVGIFQFADRAKDRLPGLGESPAQFFKKAHSSFPLLLR